MPENGFKIIGLKIDGIRKLSAVELEFADKGLIQIRGKNKQGKTSIIDSLEILLKGARHIETDMIQHDKERAEIVGYIDEYEIKRVITEKSNRLEIKNKDGLIMKEKPQAFLDKLVNALTFNPRPFLDKTHTEKLKFMMDLMKIDFTIINKTIDKQETDRLIVGREIKRIGELRPVEKAEKIVVADLLKVRDDIGELNEDLKTESQGRREQAIQEVYEFNELQTARKRKFEEVDKELADYKEALASSQEQIESYKRNIENIKANIETATREKSKLTEPEAEKDINKIDVPDPVLESTEGIDKQISEAENSNVKADEYEKFLEKKTEKDDKEKEYERLSSKIKVLRSTKKVRLKETKLPVEGLEIREDGLYYNDVFSENWGEAEALRIASELCIGMNPKLRAVFIDKGEAYDVDNLKELQEWAIANDLQAIITVVDSTGGTSEGDVIYLEEGKVV